MSNGGTTHSPKFLMDLPDDALDEVAQAMCPSHTLLGWFRMCQSYPLFRTCHTFYNLTKASAILDYETSKTYHDSYHKIHHLVTPSTLHSSNFLFPTCITYFGEALEATPSAKDQALGNGIKTDKEFAVISVSRSGMKPVVTLHVQLDASNYALEPYPMTTSTTRRPSFGVQTDKEKDSVLKSFNKIVYHLRFTLNLHDVLSRLRTPHGWTRAHTVEKKNLECFAECFNGQRPWPSDMPERDEAYKHAHHSTWNVEGLTFRTVSPEMPAIRFTEMNLDVFAYKPSHDNLRDCETIIAYPTLSTKGDDALLAQLRETFKITAACATMPFTGTTPQQYIYCQDLELKLDANLSRHTSSGNCFLHLMRCANPFSTMIVTRAVLAIRSNDSYVFTFDRAMRDMLGYVPPSLDWEQYRDCHPDSHIEQPGVPLKLLSEPKLRQTREDARTLLIRDRISVQTKVLEAAEEQLEFLKQGDADPGTIKDAYDKVSLNSALLASHTLLYQSIKVKVSMSGKLGQRVQYVWPSSSDTDDDEHDLRPAQKALGWARVTLQQQDESRGSDAEIDEERDLLPAYHATGGAKSTKKAGKVVAKAGAKSRAPIVATVPNTASVAFADSATSAASVASAPVAFASPGAPGSSSWIPNTVTGWKRALASLDSDYESDE